MTALWILSDLHLDHGGLRPYPPAGADIAVIAGDVVDDEFLEEIASRLPVVFVAGNHEFYGGSIGGRVAELSDLPIAFLNDDAVSVSLSGRKRVRIIGSTLWTDYGRDPVAAEAARRGMNDHRKIAWTKEPWQRFLPSHATALHERGKAHIAAAVAQPFDGATVVLTHHAPSAHSVHPRYAGQVLNRAYYSDLDDLVEASAAALWVHGHVHNNFDYSIGQTRVVCNPRGYPGENSEFNPALIVEV
jgi:predicted phosphodiesterase